MSDAIWWIGAIHVAAYALVGTIAALAYLAWRASRYFGFLGEIIKWKVAQGRWGRRHTHGLTDAEWKRGEPRP